MSNRELKSTYDSKAVRIVATTNDVDRDGEVVDPKGVKNLKSYLSANPVILWQHRHNEAPVGKATGGRVFDNRVELDIEWAPTPMGQEVKALYDNGFMNSFSIGFIPTKSEDRMGQFTWSEWELLEVSAVSIPANPMANVIRSAEKDGLDLVTLKGMYREASPVAEMTAEQGVATEPASEQEEPEIKEYTMDDKNIDIEAIRKEERQKFEAELAAKADAEQREAEKKEIKELREKLAEVHAKAQIEEPDFEDVKGKGGENYRGVNLGMAQKAFANKQANKSDKHLRMAEQEVTKDVLKAFVDMQQRALAQSGVTKDMTNTDANGGYLNPIITNELMGYARLNSVALRRATVHQMQSDYEKIPIENAKVTLGYTAENAEAVETSATFTQAELTAKDLDGYADVSMHLEMDTATPIAALLLDQFTEAYGQKIDSAVFAGTGDPISGVFLGFGRSEVFDTGSTSFSEVLATNLINAIGKLEEPRRRNAAFYSGRTALWTYLNNLKDGNDKPFMAQDLTGAVAARLLGYPVEETEYAPADAADTAMAIFGDLSKFIIGSRLSNLTLFRDPYSLSALHYVRYVFWTRVAFANPLPNSFVGIVTAS